MQSEVEGIIESCQQKTWLLFAIMVVQTRWYAILALNVIEEHK